ncbi:MAG: HD domain-containing protein [Candidatus Diapherotrites archaeon]
MNVPSREEALALLEKHKMPKHILAHSLAVEKIARFLAEKLREKGEAVNLELVVAAALLHDIDKHKTFLTGNHGDEGERILREEGFPEVGRLVAMHNLGRILGKLNSLEEKIVWLSDKRVNHDKIVSLKERFAYLKKAYGEKSAEKMKAIASCQAPAEKLEEEIFKKAGADKSLSELK